MRVISFLFLMRSGREPGAGLAKGRVQPDHCRQALSCRRLAREVRRRDLRTLTPETLNIIRIV